MRRVTPVQYAAAMTRTDQTSKDPSASLIGRAVRVRRIELGLTLEALARSAGVSAATISRIERGLAVPTSARTIHGLTNALAWPRTALERLRAGEDPEQLDLEGPTIPIHKPLVRREQLADIRIEAEILAERAQRLARRIAELEEE
jgi:transcriptional regulator with XRE-family HTH domain